MLFNSFHFLLFFPIVAGLYFIMPYKYRWLWLLLASCFFYMFFKAVYILILFFTILIDYFAGIYIEKAKLPKTKKRLLLLSIVANVLVLGIFKYFNFLNDSVSGILSWAGYSNPVPALAILLPIGLSFHTFQAMSYTIEVYRGNQKAEQKFGIYALYVMFFPQLVAGPIERPQNMLHQFYEKHPFNPYDASEGLKRILIGLFKKVVVADRLAIYVNAVYGNYEHHGSLSLIMATVFFSFQIYCDFSGYSDIAIGTARVLGFRLMENFDRPYFAKSISEFWSKWHISLSTWFRDYLYIPMGGNRVSMLKWYRNLFVVFMLSGLWHGANWTFIVWGALHGTYLILEIVFRKLRGPFQKWKFLSMPNLSGLLQVTLTFLLVTLAWIFFRADNIAQALGIVKRIFSFEPGFFLGQPNYFFYSILAILSLLCYELRQEFHWQGIAVSDLRFPWRLLTYGALVFAIMLFGVFDGSQFIYFQF